MLEIFLLEILTGLIVILVVICNTKLTAGRAQMVVVGEVTLTAMIIKEQSKLLNETL